MSSFFSCHLVNYLIFLADESNILEFTREHESEYCMITCQIKIYCDLDLVLVVIWPGWATSQLLIFVILVPTQPLLPKLFRVVQEQEFINATVFIIKRTISGLKILVNVAKGPLDCLMEGGIDHHEHLLAQLHTFEISPILLSILFKDHTEMTKLSLIIAGIELKWRFQDTRIVESSNP